MRTCFFYLWPSPNFTETFAVCERTFYKTFTCKCNLLLVPSRLRTGEVNREISRETSMSLPESQTPEPSFSTISSSQLPSSTQATPAKESQNGVKKRTRKRASILTDDQKKKHHIKSEHKRRQAIREAFEKLVDIVPELTTNDSRSEIVVLNKSSEYLRQLHGEYKYLMSLAKERGFPLDDELVVNIPKGQSGD